MGGSCYGWTLRNAESMPHCSEPYLADPSVVFEGCGWGEVSSRGRRIFEGKSGRGKHVHHLVRCAGVEYARHNVRINAVSPGFVRTPRLNQRLDEAT